MSLPTFVKLPNDRDVSARSVINQAFGGEENVPSEDGVFVHLGFMTRSYGRSRVGLQIKVSPYRDNDFRRAVKSDQNGLLDAEKIRDKYNEVFKYGQEDKEYVQRLEESREESRNKREQLRDEVKEVFSGSEVFKPYNEDIFHYDFSYEEMFNRDVVDGHMKVTPSGVEMKLEELTVDESQQVVDFILKMRGK